MTDSAAVDAAAARLREARASGRPCPPVRDLLGEDVGAAYEVQRRNNELEVLEGRRRAGWKIGLTNPAVQAQLGVDQPDFGMLFADTEGLDDLPLRWDALLQPRVEAEVAFVLDRDLDQAPVTAADVVRATAFVLPAIEIVDSRVAAWDINVSDTIADNASSGMYVIGARPTPLHRVDLRSITMQLTDSEGNVVSSGSGAGCLGHPVNAVVWLANTMVRHGEPLAAGDLLLSGALGPMHAATAGAVYEATIEGLGSVRARFDARADVA